MRTFVALAIIGVAAAAAPPAHSYFNPGDAPKCWMHNGRTIVHFDPSHTSFKCSHNAALTKCTCQFVHPSHHFGKCQEFDHHDGKKTTTHTIGGDCTNKGRNPVNCVGSWSAFSTCANAGANNCGNGKKSRTYRVSVAQVGSGTPCPIADGTVFTTNCVTCPVDCVGAWSSYTTCSKTCGGGRESRTFTHTTKQAGTGKHCNIADGQVYKRSCNTQTCNVDCVETVSVGSCVGTCGQGTRTTTRTVTQAKRGNGKQCVGTTTASCQTGIPCTFKPFIYDRSTDGITIAGSDSAYVPGGISNQCPRCMAGLYSGSCSWKDSWCAGNQISRFSMDPSTYAGQKFQLQTYSKEVDNVLMIWLVDETDQKLVASTGRSLYGDYAGDFNGVQCDNCDNPGAGGAYKSKRNKWGVARSNTFTFKGSGTHQYSIRAGNQFDWNVGFVKDVRLVAVDSTKPNCGNWGSSAANANCGPSIHAATGATDLGATSSFGTYGVGRSGKTNSNVEIYGTCNTNQNKQKVDGKFAWVGNGNGAAWYGAPGFYSNQHRPDFVGKARCESACKWNPHCFASVWFGDRSHERGDSKNRKTPCKLCIGSRTGVAGASSITTWVKN